MVAALHHDRLQTKITYMVPEISCTTSSPPGALQMRLLVHLKSAFPLRTREARKVRRSRDELIGAYEADVERVLSCAERVEQKIWRDFGVKVKISPLPIQNALIVDCPDSDRISEIRKGILAACEEVESVSEDHRISMIEDSVQMGGVP
jgi:hypothetical protein